MRVAVFASDKSAAHAALLATHALAIASDAGLAVGPPVSPFDTEETVAGHLDDASAAGLDAVVAQPLHRLASVAVRSRLHLCVVAPGTCRVSDGLVRRAAAAAPRRPGLAPIWFVGDDAPDGCAALPSMRLHLRPAEVAGLRGGRADADLVERAVGLAAAMLLAAANPDADALDRADLLEALAGGGGSVEMQLRTRLLRLADLLHDHGTAGRGRGVTAFRRADALGHARRDRGPARRGTFPAREPEPVSDCPICAARA